MTRRTHEVTLEEVARVAGVSHATASRALHGTRPVRRDNADRVRAAAERLGYAVDIRAQETARGLATAASIVVPALTDAESMRLAAAVHDALQSAALRPSVLVGDIGADDAGDLVRRLRGQRDRAIVLLGRGRPIAPAVHRELAEYIDRGGIALVLDVAASTRASAAASLTAQLTPPRK